MRDTDSEFNSDHHAESSVFFCKKVLSNDSALTYRVDMLPVTTEHRCGYQFSVELEYGDRLERIELSDVTSEASRAERLFNLIVANNVFPCHLCDVTEDFITA